MSGLQYAGARFYDPEMGMFLTHDPAGQFANPYAYGPWDPINGSDPSGAFWWIPYVAVALYVPGVAAGVGQALANGASLKEAGTVGVQAAIIGGIFLAGGLGIVGGIVASATEGAQAAMIAASTAYGTYTTVRSFQSGQFIVGGLGALVSAFGLIALARGFGSLSGGAAQGANGELGGSQFAQLDSDSLSDANDDVRNPAVQFQIEAAESRVHSPAIAAPPNVDIDANIRAAQNHWGDPFWFRDQVRNRAPWDYKQLGGNYQAFGNFNYGATGKAAGLPEGLLLREAGRAQIAAGTSRPEWGTPGSFRFFGGSGTFGDDPVDQFWIRSGFRYFDEYSAR